jgi:hypothetical protein
LEENNLVDTLKISLSTQTKAALSILKYCIESCPDNDWEKPQGDAPFCQVVFHARFYADFYLGRDAIPFKEQSYHIVNKVTFADYEEMEDRIPVKMYSKEFCHDYLAQCLKKVDSTMSGETAESLEGESGISFRNGSRMELYIYSTRHIQHHAAQLGLRIQMMTGKAMPWFSGH